MSGSRTGHSPVFRFGNTSFRLAPKSRDLDQLHDAFEAKWRLEECERCWFYEELGSVRLLLGLPCWRGRKVQSLLEKPPRGLRAGICPESEPFALWHRPRQLRETCEASLLLRATVASVSGRGENQEKPLG